MERGHPAQARAVLERIRGTADVHAELADIADAAAAAAAVPQLEAWKSLFRRAHRPQLVLSSLIPTFQQWWVNALWGLGRAVDVVGRWGQRAGACAATDCQHAGYPPACKGRYLR